MLWMPGIADLVDHVNQGVLKWGLSATWRSMMVPAGGGPRHSQFSGMVFQECFKRMSSQRCERGVARRPRGRVERRKSTEIQW